MNEIKLGKKISEGKTVDVYESGDLAVKVFKPDAPKTVVFYEAFMDSKVEETGLNVPKIKEVELIDGKWASYRAYKGQDACTDHAGRA